MRRVFYLGLDAVVVEANRQYPWCPSRRLRIGHCRVILPKCTPMILSMPSTLAPATIIARISRSHSGSPARTPSAQQAFSSYSACMHCAIAAHCPRSATRNSSTCHGGLLDSASDADSGGEVPESRNFRARNLGIGSHGAGVPGGTSVGFLDGRERRMPYFPDDAHRHGGRSRGRSRTPGDRENPPRLAVMKDRPFLPTISEFPPKNQGGKVEATGRGWKSA